ncbi:MAG: ribosome small subunit-dependent GTPase A [Myxococcales bacterium]|nr:ribosome small subunit-dependent GTPase A [Myxococcales bacterium]MCB9717554.1 ribosome small subunit-dependent GTPase A [Myxococcales bacterium]
MDLIDLGYGPDLHHAFSSLSRPDLRPARVIREDRGRLLVDDGAGPRPAEPLGRLRQADPLQWPAVGDWVALAPIDDGPSLVHAVLPRRSAFVRGQAGRRDAPQCVAANVDTVLVAMALDGDLNLRRLERYLVLVLRSGAAAVVLLTKADRCADPAAARERVASVAGDTPIHVICAPRDEGLDALAGSLHRGTTVALVGSSGVGKSTLINHLLGHERMATGVVLDDGRGRHTTRSRQLVVLPGGGCLIDTPGMRELQLWGEEDDLDAGFADIDELAAGCRFRDCEHESEPGCAVRAAVDEGRLDPERLASFAKLRAELRAHAERSDPQARRRQGRRFAKMATQVQRLKRR